MGSFRTILLSLDVKEVPMGLAAIAGIGSGAVHAVAAPDHVLSLAPLSVGSPRNGWRVGLLWGIGHGAGTLVAALALMAGLAAVDLPGIEAWAERIAGIALIGLGAWGLVRRRQLAAGAAPGGGRAVATVGLIHGLTGAAALLLLLPAAVHASPAYRALYLAGFTIGSTLAMAAFTACLAALTQKGRCAALLSGRLPAIASALSIALGAVWLAGIG